MFANGIRHDCRQNTELEITHCRHDVSSVPGFQFIGQDKIGFNMWVANDGKTTETTKTTDSETRRRRSARQESQKKLNDRADRSVNSLNRLSIPDRDRAIQELLAQLDLSPTHLQNLRDRGLSDNQIERGMFRSVVPWQSVNNINARLAGVSDGSDGTGQKLSVSGSGTICPIWDVSGRIIGWQTRFDRSKDGKYRWPTSRNQQNPNGATAHLPNGEMPLSCCRPTTLLPDPQNSTSPHQSINLAEGFLKPYIAAQQIERVFIGAAGGNFSASPQTLKTYLDTLSTELSTKLVRLYPDAGAIANFNVLRQYQKAIALVTGWGYEVEIAWWKQFDKNTHADIDELTAAQLSEITYITPAAFFSLCDRDMQNRLADRPDDTGTIYRLKLWLSRTIDRYLPHQGFAPPQNKTQSETQSKPQETKTPQRETIAYKPGKLPSPYNCDSPTKITFKPDQRLQLLRELVMAGWQHILDTSAPGTGKSHEAGIATPSHMGVRQLFYFSAQHRNPTVATIERNYIDLPVRHNGMKLDKTRQTPSGKDWEVWAKEGEKPDTIGNCFRTPLFNTLRQKNVPDIDSTDNPICATCHLQDVCKGKSGEGFGFRHSRRQALTFDRIRAHPDSAPNLAYDWPNVGIFWDEAIPTIAPTQTITARLVDIDRAIAQVATQLPHEYLQLRLALTAIRQRLSGELAQPYYGWGDRELRQALGELPIDIEAIAATVAAATQPDLNFLEMPDSIAVSKITGLTKAEASLLRSASQTIRQADYQEARQQLQERLLLNWLAPFLEIWSGHQQGALRIDNGKLTITIRNPRHGAIARAAKWNCYQDATATPDYLGLWLGISPQQIITIEQELHKCNNLEVIQVQGLGLAGKNRSDLCQQRIDALRQELQRLHPDIGFIDWKNKASTGDGAWFVTSRGSNQFETRGAIASFGIPYTNIGSLADRYRALTGQLTGQTVNLDEDPDFQAFVQWTTNAEITQAVGRLRSHLRPQQKLKFYFCADYDLPPELNAKLVRAVDITPEAGTNPEQLWLKITETFQKIYDDLGRAPSLAEITNKIGIKQSHLSKLFKQFAGGWKQWLKIFQSLLDTPYRSWNISDPDYQAIAETYLPILAHQPPNDMLKEFCDIIEALGWQGWQRILGLTAFDTRSRLARAMLDALP
ncbi:MAG: hypothetical protein HC856_00525 [Pseudanabaena sp. RU_4_16]|nr:hypothetical protein [Pseudanabaena sp. RU_4_16]